MRTSRRSVRDAANAPTQLVVFRAYLAEDYDGINQTVMVALNRSATSAAAKAFIGGGDFATAARTPRGTPVVVRADRGRLTIISGIGSAKEIITSLGPEIILDDGPACSIQDLDLFSRLSNPGFGHAMPIGVDWDDPEYTSRGWPLGPPFTVEPQLFPSVLAHVTGSQGLLSFSIVPSTPNGVPVGAAVVRLPVQFNPNEYRLGCRITFGLNYPEFGPAVSGSDVANAAVSFAMILADSWDYANGNSSGFYSEALEIQLSKAIPSNGAPIQYSTELTRNGSLLSGISEQFALAPSFDLEIDRSVDRGTTRILVPHFNGGVPYEIPNSAADPNTGTVNLYVQAFAILSNRVSAAWNPFIQIDYFRACGLGVAVDCNCGATDVFARFVATQSVSTALSLGTSNSGLTWWITATWRNTPPTVGVDGSSAVLTFTDANSPSAGSQIIMSLVTPPQQFLIQTHSFTFSLDNLGRPYEDIIIMRISGWTPASASAYVVINPRNDGVVLSHGDIGWGSSFGSGTAIPTSFWQVGVVYTVSLFETGGNMRVQISDGSSSYSQDIGYSSNALVDWPAISLERRATNVGTGLDDPDFIDWTLRVDTVDAPEFTRCSMLGLFDNFSDRLAVGGWGAASSHMGTWEVQFNLNSDFSVANSIGGWPTAGWQTGRWDADATPAVSHGGNITVVSGPWETETGFTFTFWFMASEGSCDPFWEFGTNADAAIELWMNNTNGYIYVASDNYNNDDQQSKTDWEFGQWYIGELRYTPNGLAEVRVWRSNADRPSTPDVDVDAILPIVGQMSYLPFATNPGSRIQLANLSFDYRGKGCWEA